MISINIAQMHLFRRKARSIQHHIETAPAIPKSSDRPSSARCASPSGFHVWIFGKHLYTWTCILRNCNCRSLPCRLYIFKSMISLSQDAFWSHLYTLGNSKAAQTSLPKPRSLASLWYFPSRLLIFFFFFLILTPKMQVICEIIVIAASLFHGQGAWAAGNLK